MFYPPRRTGIILNASLLLALLGAGLLSLRQASRAGIGGEFLVYLLPVLVAVLAAPSLAYRIYALQVARYILLRDGIRLVWGLRSEIIPMNQVLWVRSARESGLKFSLPVLHWPGSVLGAQKLADGKEMEFLAASAKPMIFIATQQRIYAISPADPQAFLSSYRQAAEWGSLAPLQAHSISPAFVLSRFWEDALARVLIFTAGLLAIGLLVWASLAVPQRQTVAIRISPQGSPVEMVPAVRLLLLPLMNGFFVFVDALLGSFFYRQDESHLVSYLLWGMGVLSTILFTIGVLFILRAG